MEDQFLSGEDLDALLRQVCCGGECRANDDPDEQGICSRFGYRSKAEAIVTKSLADADSMLIAVARRYGAAKP